MLTKQDFLSLCEPARGMLKKTEFGALAWQKWIDFCQADQMAWASTMPTGSIGAPETRDQLIRQQFPHWDRPQVLAAIACDDHILPLIASGELTEEMFIHEDGYFAAKEVRPHTCSHDDVGASTPSIHESGFVITGVG